jgi:hypothetical protein
VIVFTVHEPEKPKLDPMQRALDVVFIRDGFSWAAFAFGPLWLIAHRMWLLALGFLAAYGLFEVALRLLPGGSEARMVALSLAAIGFGLEANNLRRWRLDRRGWRMIGSVTGKTAEECEQRFFAAWLGEGGQGSARVAAAGEAASSPAPQSPAERDLSARIRAMAVGGGAGTPAIAPQQRSEGQV